MYGGIEGLFDLDRWVVAAIWVWIGLGLVLATVSRSAMASRLRHRGPDGEPVATPYMVRRALLRSYLTYFGFDANSGVFCAAILIILTGLGALVVMHQRLGT